MSRLRLFACIPCAALLFLADLARSQDDLDIAARVKQYASVRLTADLDVLTDKQRQMLPLLIEAAQQMNIIFWQESYGQRKELFAKLRTPAERRLATINYGPWDRLDENKPFIAGVGPKPPGAQFYPPEMTKEAFESYLESHPKQRAALTSLYTVVRRNKNGTLRAVPYSKRFPIATKKAADKLREAAALAENGPLKAYLLARADALLSDDYQASDLLWMDMKTNTLDIVIGPIETYEDRLFGYKAAHEAYVLIKDTSWSERLSKYATWLPKLQQGLPVPDAYKQETPGSNSDLNAYDVVYYAGDCNAGSKTIAINLPNDEEVQLQKGTRRLQLKNAMKAKFDKILVPISQVLIAEDQRQHITFNAFFSNTMFHEVAHGLGIKYTIDKRSTVREALQDLSGAIEEGKADILGLYMVTQLYDEGVVTEGALMDYYVTFMTSIFRSIRFGATSAHGKANMIRFNFFQKHGAFSRTESGVYRVNFEKMKSAMALLSEKLLTLQGNGDYEATKAFVDEMGFVGLELKADLQRLSQEAIPVDIVFQQGIDVLGLSGN